MKNSSDKKTIEEVLDAHRDELMSIKGIFGVAIGKQGDECCIQIHLSDSSEALQKKLPQTLDGYPVCLFLLDQPTITDE